MRLARTPLEFDCRTCLRATIHVQTGDRRFCKTCGSEHSAGGQGTTSGAVSLHLNGKGGTAKAVLPSSLDVPPLVPPLRSGGGLHGEALAAYDKEAAFAAFVLGEAGLELALGRRQPWLIGELELAVEVWVDERDFYVVGLLDGWPHEVRRQHGKAPASLALAELFATSWAGTPCLPGRSELSRWKRRALLQAGIVTRPAVALPALDDGAPVHARETWEGIGELVAVRALTEQVGDPVPLSAPFLSRWCPLERHAVRRGKTWLENRGFIERAGEGEFGHPRRCLLWSVVGFTEPER